MYNLTNITGSGSMLGFAENVGGILGGYYYGYFILMIIFLVTFLGLKVKGYYSSACLTVAVWVMGFVAMFLKAMGLLDTYTFWACIFLIPVSVFMLFLFGNPD